MATEIVTPATELLERASEIDRIRALVGSATRGQGGLLLIEGPAGIGKTELLEVVCWLAREAGFDVLRARGSELERELAYGILRQLFERRMRPPRAGKSGSARADLPPSVGAVLWPAPGQAPAADAASALEVLHALYWVCAETAERQPLVLAVDDAQWADTPSMRFVEYLARRAGDVRVLLAITRRTSEPDTDLAAFLRLAREPRVECLAPAALSESAVAALVRSRIGPEADELFCKACFEATGGNPFLVHELLAAAHSARVPATAAGARSLLATTPGAVSRSVQLRLATLSTEATALARAVAVLGGNAELRHAAGVAGLPTSAAARAADTLGAAAILGPGRPLDFVHPLVRAAVYAGLPQGVRAEAHREAARVLADDQAEPGRIGLHLLSTEPSNDPWVVQSLLDAGRAALAQGVPRTAVSYLERALREPPPAVLRGAVLRELGMAELRVAGRDAIPHLREALRLSRDVGEITLTARALALGLLWSGRVAELQEILDPALRAVAAHDPEKAIQLEAEVLSAARLSLSAALWAGERVERWRGRVRGDTPGERLMLANLSTQTSLGDFSANEAAELAESAAAGGQLLVEQTADAMPFYQVVYVLLCADRVEVAERLVAQAATDARARGSVLGTILGSLFGSYTTLARGDVAEAEARAEHALELAGQLEASSLHLPACVAAMVDVLVERGRLDDAERVLQAHGMDADLPDSVPFRILLFSRGALRLAQRRYRQAAGDLRELAERQGRWRAVNLPSEDVTAALALAAVGDRDAAVDRAEQAIARGRRWGTARAIGLALRALALVGDDRRLERLIEAEAVLRTSPARLDHARVLVDLGAALRRASQRSKAAHVLRHALDMAVSGGGWAVAARAREELASLGLRPRRAALTGIEALSGSERRVAELAAQGKSNPQIAQELFITVRTVEVHLTHAYQKLGIQSRAQLATALGR